MARMQTGTFKYIEQIMINYPDYDREIKKRELEIYNPYIEPDSNIGGSRSGINPNMVEKIASALIEDRILVRLKQEKQAVEKTLAVSHPTMRAVIEAYYFQRPRLLSWDGVAEKCHVHPNHAKKIRTIFFKELAEELGMLL